jgi:hypothetical protein
MKNKQDKLTFPNPESFKIKTPSVSLKEITALSEKMLPFENKKRKKTSASSFTPFVLR